MPAKTTSETIELVHRGAHPGELMTIDRNDAITLIKEGLKQRSGKTWSVTGGRGTAWGWISIEAPPARRVAHDPNPAYHRDDPEPGAVPYFEDPDPARDDRWYTSEAECTELGELLGLGRPIHYQGHSIPAASDYRRWYVALARGLEPVGEAPRPYWD